MSKNIIIVMFITIVTVIMFIASPIHAQSDVANVYDISDIQVKEGDILIFDPSKGLQKANLPYDSHLFGVFANSPGLVFRRTDNTGKPVIRSGIAKVNVSSGNGQIKKGDFITSSTLPGFGMKATSPGYVIGIALEDAKENQGRINMAVTISFKDLTGSPNFNKNILAGLIILISIILGLFILSRVMPKAIEAIGRNPLAKRTIEFSLILNIIIVAAVVIGTIIAAVIILRL